MASTAITTKKHTRIAGDFAVLPEDWFDLFSASLNDPIPVANTTERSTVLAELAGLTPSITPSTSKPIFFHQSDLPSHVRTIYTQDGSNFISLSGMYVWADAAERVAATGMATDARGFQLDTRVEYRYVGGSWKPWTSDWLTYTPTLVNVTLGTGSFSDCRYRFAAGDLCAHGRFTLGSGSSVSTGAGVQHPASLSAVGVGALGFFPVGDLVTVNAGSARRGVAVPASSSAVAFYIGTPLALVGGSSPAAFTTGDILQWSYRVPLT